MKGDHKKKMSIPFYCVVRSTVQQIPVISNRFRVWESLCSAIDNLTLQT